MILYIIITVLCCFGPHRVCDPRFEPFLFFLSRRISWSLFFFSFFILLLLMYVCVRERLFLMKHLLQSDYQTCLLFPMLCTSVVFVCVSLLANDMSDGTYLNFVSHVIVLFDCIIFILGFYSLRF